MSTPSRLRSIVDLRPGEGTLAALMASYFFLVITSFWILKPIKKTLFLGHYADHGSSWLGAGMAGPEAEQLAKVSNMVVAAGATAVFSWLARSLRREQLTTVFSAFFLVCYGGFALLLSSPGELGVWAFYLFGDLFSTLMVATFFAFLNDSVDPDAAKRLFGLVGFGGVAGGVFGSSIVASWISDLSTPQWLGVLAVVALAIVGTARAAGARVAARPVAPEPPPADDAPPPSPSGNPALAGARLALRSPYLLAIVAVVGLYEIVSTIVDYQFTKSIVHFVPEKAAQGQHFATVFAITNWVSMFVQLFLTSFVMRRFGLATALLLLPLSILTVSTGYLILPGLWIASALNTADNGLSYSINQSAKEALYVPTTPEEKYLAKAFIDMFVQRFAKALAVGISLGVAALFPTFEAVRWLTLALAPLLALWGWAALFAGRRFAALTRDGGSD